MINARLNDQNRVPGDSEGSGFRELLHQCCERAVRPLSDSVSRMMEKVDDALFELAEKAESTDAQQLYFDAMREVRIKRAEIEKRFKDNVVTGFNAKLKPVTDQDTDDGEGGDMLLMESEELEGMLAVATLTGKIRSSCREELPSLNQRMGLLIEEPELDSDANPIGPDVISNAFKDACDVIEADLRVLLIVLKLFDRFVISDILAIYTELNQFLISSGILPKIRPTINKIPGSVRGQSDGAAMEIGDSAQLSDLSEQDLFALYQQVQGGNPQIALAATAAGSGQGGVASVGPIQDLTFLQRGAVPAGGNLPDLSSTNLGQVNILRNLRASSLNSTNEALDDMVIDMVATLFDFVLVDHSIPDSIRALIGRLQIPVLKVALIDKNFFAKQAHPARRLVNVISRAAIGWHADSEHDDPFYKIVDRIVGRILEEFEDDTQVFETLLVEFSEFIEAEKERSDDRAEHTAKLVDGKERLVITTRAADAYIQRQIAGKPLPEFLVQFIATHWKDLLVLTGVRDGESSYIWSMYTNTLEHLLWSIEPATIEKDRQRLLETLPGLVGRLTSGINEVSADPGTAEEFMKLLSSYYASLVGTDESDGFAAAVGESCAAATVGDALYAGAEKLELTTYAEQAQIEQESSDIHYPEEAIKALFGDMDFDIEEIIVEDLAEVEAGESIEDEHMEAAKNMEKGTWIEIKEADGTFIQACLKWISSLSHKYMFTDRDGVKVAEISLAGLAAQLRSGDIVIIDDAPLLDRALGHLKEVLEEKATAK